MPSQLEHTKIAYNPSEKSARQGQKLVKVYIRKLRNSPSKNLPGRTDRKRTEILSVVRIVAVPWEILRESQ